jgi:hypothetical protein
MQYHAAVHCRPNGRLVHGSATGTDGLSCWRVAPCCHRRGSQTMPSSRQFARMLAFIAALHTVFVYSPKYFRYDLQR